MDPKVDTLAFDREVSTEAHLTWWGCSSVEITTGNTTLVVDPYQQPTQGVDHVFVTHEHYDHCHVPTIERFVDGLEGLYVSRSCAFDSELFYASPDLPLPRRLDAQVLYPEIVERVDPHTETTKWPTYDPENNETPPTQVECGPFSVTAVEAPGEEAQIPGASVVSGPLAQLSYLIRDNRNDITYYHAGDIRRAYAGLHEIRGQVDVLFFPIGMVNSCHGDPLSFQIRSDVFFIDVINPEYVVPIHYTHGGEYPLDTQAENTDPIEVQVQDGLLPAVDDPERYIKSLKNAVDGSRVVPTQAGTRVAIRSN